MKPLFLTLIFILLSASLASGQPEKLAEGHSPDSLAARDSVEFLPVNVYTEEDHRGRWLTVSFQQENGSASILSPQLEVSAADGKLAIRFAPLFSAFLDRAVKTQEAGQFPVQHVLSSPDSNSILLSIETLPFEDIKTSYSFDSNEYLVEIIYGPQRPVIVPAAPPVADSGHDLQKVEPKETPSIQPVVSRTMATQKMFKNSMILAGVGSAVLVLLIVLIIYFNRKKQIRSRKQFSEVLAEQSAKKAPVEHPANQPEVTFTEEMKEARIRELMSVENLTYDEATLRYQVEAQEISHG